MNDADREAVRRAVSETIEDMIVISHGTDKVLSDIPDKAIVLAGALSPALFKTFDAMFNIGEAFTAAQTKPAGVYIVMNGVIFDRDRASKDVGQNKFVAL